MRKENEYPKIKKRYKLLGQYLPFKIEGEPVIIEENQVGFPKDTIINTANDEFLIYDLSLVSFDANLGVGKGLIGIFSSVCFLGFIMGIENTIYLVLLNLIGVYFILRAYTLPEQKIIFDRQNGLFTYPGFAWNKAVTIPFHEAVVAITSTNSGTVPGPPHLTAYHPNGFTGANLCSHMQIQSWWLFVWYMDKNRPLPPGTAFDPYRQKDYERRKAEGFPPPLYESKIPTPEYVPGSENSILDNLN